MKPISTNYLKKYFLLIVLFMTVTISSYAQTTVSCAFGISITYTVTQPTCTGANDGEITITVNGATAPYFFAVYPSLAGSPITFNDPVSNTHTFTGLTPDPDITVQGRGNVGGVFRNCFAFNEVLADPLPVNVVTISQTNPSCAGGNDGAIDIDVTGGTPGYTYLWSNGATTQDISGLTAGNYSVMVTDANGCTSNANYTLTDPATITIPGVVTDVLCNGANTGAINITPAGGTPGYTYLWSNGATTEDISGLAAGAYTVTVTDANGCIQNANFTVNQPTPISIPGVVTDVLCNGGNTGAINITPAGGTPGYTFLWSNGATTEDISGLTAGSYSVTVTDANGCPQIANFTVNQSPAITIPGVVTNVLCNGAATGAINITPGNGTAPYTFAWSNGASTEDISGLTAGSYSVTVTDANGCTNNASFNVTQPAAISVPGVITNVSCNGGNNGAVNITPAGGVAPYTFLWSNGATTEDISGLTAGMYSVTVTDANGCPQNASFNVTQPAAITIPGVVTNVVCNGGNTGAINITPAGGTAPYTFLWSNGATTEDISGLAAGAYTVTVTDANGCTNNANFNITQTSPITAPGVITNVTCSGGSNGAVNITPAGGTAPYTFLWSNGATTEDISGLTAGSYSVTVTDANGCTLNASFNVTQPTPIIIPGVVTNVSCNGGNNGAINITPSGGNAPYTFLWSNGATTEDISGLAAGSYTVTVTDASACSRNVSFTVTQPTTISIPGVVTNVLCNGGNTGAINITPAGGTAPYTFLWSNGATTEDISGLTAGAYTVTVTDANGCTNNANFNVTQPAMALTVPGVVTDLLCNGASTGAINITPAGGTAPYTFLWSNGAITEDINGLTAGAYTVTVTDANGCTQNANFTVNQPTPISVPGIVTDVLCNGGNTGAINITPAGGTAPYTFLWSNGATTEDIGGLVAGSYTVTVTDANGCPQNANFTVNEPTPISIPGVATNVLCNAGTTGAIDITPSGGTAPYTFLWSNGATTEDISGLAAGAYTVTVTDANGCSNNANFIITEPAAPVSVMGIVTDVTCNGGSNGAINITPSGGTAPYTFSWSNGASTEDISGLTAGAYTVIITDANGCTTNGNFTVNEPTPISIPGVVTDATCNGGSNGAIDITPAGGNPGYTYLWSNGATTEDISGLTAGSYTVTVTDASGCSNNATFAVNEPAPIAIPGVVTDASCNGNNDGAIDITPSGGTAPYTFAWSNGASTEDINTLAPGSYTVTVTDANGCSNNASFTVNVGLAILIPGVVTDVLCNGNTTGAIDITPSNGTLPYTFLWSNGATSEDISGLAAGSYTVTVTDANGCNNNASFTINEPAAPLSLTGTTVDVTCNGGNNGSIDLSPSGGTAPYTFSWSNGASTEDINTLTAGMYSVTVTDANGCTANTSFTINEPIAITIPGVVTDVICNGGNNGAIDITPANGVGAYTFVWSNGATTEDISGLTAGSYTVTVTDANGCSQGAVFVVNEPAAIAIPGIVTNTSCSGNADGAIDITPSGGTAPYTFSWSNGASTEDISALLAGSYTVTVTDAAGCSNNATFAVNNPITIDVTGTTIDASCNGGSSGSIDITVTGGTGTYTFLWSNGATTEDISGLAAGSYTVTATDGNGCSGNASFTINEPTPLVLSAVDAGPICNSASNGQVTLSASGGVAPYTYSNDGLSFNSITVYSSLTPGTYTFFASDAAGCTTSSNATVSIFPVVDIASIVPTIQNLTCNAVNTGSISLSNVTGGTAPYSYSLNGGSSQALPNFSGLSAGSHVIVITDANSCPYPYLFTITSPPAINFDINVLQQETCNNGDGILQLTNVSGGVSPYTYQFNGGAAAPYTGPVTVPNLTAGTYNFTIIDNSNPPTNCQVTKTVILPKKSGPIPYIRIIEPKCYQGSDGIIVIDSLQGGVPPFQYYLNGTNMGGSTVMPNLSAGTYTMDIQDMECTYAMTQFYVFNGIDYDTIPLALTVGEPTAIAADTFSVLSTKYLNSGMAGIYNLSGGTSPYQYSFDSITFFVQTQDTISLGNVGRGGHQIFVRDTNNCAAVFTIYVEVGFFIPNMITPNNDGSNDYFEIISLPRNSKLIMYNRWGHMVYQSDDYDNTFNGDGLSDGVYYWDLILPNSTTFNGWLNIVR